MKELSCSFTFNVKSNWLFEGEKRLNASSFSPDATKSKSLIDNLKKKGVKIEPIKDLVKYIFYPGRFKRNYSNKGITFLSSKDIFDLLPIGKKIKKPSKEYFIDPNWILVSRSGSVGKIMVAFGLMADAAISEHVIRIIPSNNTPIGYLYIYLNSKIGQSYLLKNIFGGVVNEIEPNHIESILIPRIPKLEKEINKDFTEIQKLRKEMQNLLLKAKDLLYSELNIPKEIENKIDYYGGKQGEYVKSFEVNVNELNLRLDASFHTPKSKMIIKILNDLCKTNNFEIKKLVDVAKVFDLPTYKRVYIDSDGGLPVLSGVHIKQFKCFDLKYISDKVFVKNGKNFVDHYRIKKGWILTTERGTTGISSLVSDYWDGWLASHNILRVVPKDVNPGFLLIYLTTKYAQIQLKSKELGAVVEVLDPRDMENILVPLPKKETNIQERIGSMVTEAYDKKDRANKIEQDAIRKLENKLIEICGMT